MVTKKDYNSPNVSLVLISEDDVIRTSGNGTFATDDGDNVNTWNPFWD